MFCGLHSSPEWDGCASRLTVVMSPRGGGEGEGGGGDGKGGGEGVMRVC